MRLAWNQVVCDEIWSPARMATICQQKVNPLQMDFVRFHGRTILLRNGQANACGAVRHSRCGSRIPLPLIVILVSTLDRMCYPSIQMPDGYDEAPVERYGCSGVS